jgi:hypothetical protein
MNAHEFINYELEFDPNNPYIPIKEEIIGMLDGRGDAVDNEPIEEVDNVQISDVVIDSLGFKDDVESALVTLKQFLEQRPSDVTPYDNIQTRQKELGSWHAQESHETPIDSFFHTHDLYILCIFTILKVLFM